jgi:diacylglycerol kinase (ATP)
MDPLAAVAQMMSYQPRRIPVGQVATARGTLWFAVMAGGGPDGMLVDELSRAGGDRLKARFGRAAYYSHAARLLLTRHWPEFTVKYKLPGSSEWTTVEAIAVMASRVADLGGVFSGTTRLASMTKATLHVQIVRGPGWASLPAWMVCGWLGLPNRWLTTLDCAEVQCDGARVYAQADAEPIGHLPITMRVIPAALSVLMPADAA